MKFVFSVAVSGYGGAMKVDVYVCRFVREIEQDSPKVIGVLVGVYYPLAFCGCYSTVDEFTLLDWFCSLIASPSSATQ